MFFKNNEKGIALVLALVMLVLLTILGTYALSTSSTELFIAGNYRNSQLAFYAADAGQEYGQKDGNIYNAIIPGTTNVWPVTGAGNYTSTDSNNKNFNTVNIGAGATPSAAVQVEFLEYGPPTNIKSDANTGAGGLKVAYFTVRSIGTGQANAQAQVESLIGRMVPSTDTN